MKTNVLIVLLVLLPLFTRAQTSLQKEDQRVAKIDPRSTEDFFQYVFDYEVIALKGDGDFILPSLRLIGTTADRIFATTKSVRRNAVYVFDGKGNHIVTIKRAGQGPGEYMGIRSVMPYGDGFGLIDVLGQKVLVFDNMGNYKKELKLNHTTSGLIRGADGYFAVLPEDMSRKHGKIGVLDDTFQLDTAFLDGGLAGKSRIMSNGQIQSVLGGFAYAETNTTGIYHGNRKEVWPAYYFDFGSYNPEIDENGIPALNDKVSLITFSETRDCVYLEYALGLRNYQLSVYSKRDGMVTNHPLKQLVGEELLGMSTGDDMWRYIPIPAPAVEKLIEKLKPGSATFASGLSASDVLESENPVILKFRFF